MCTFIFVLYTSIEFSFNSIAHNFNHYLARCPISLSLLFFSGVKPHLCWKPALCLPYTFTQLFSTAGKELQDHIKRCQCKSVVSHLPASKFKDAPASAPIFSSCISCDERQVITLPGSNPAVLRSHPHLPS